MNASEQPVFSYDPDQDIYLTIGDGDENEDSAALDTLSVVVTNLSNGDSETVTLTEQTVTSAVFFGSVSSQTSLGISGDGTLQYMPGDNLQVQYTDAQDGDDTLSVILQSTPVVWDGGGRDNNFSTPENWSTDTVPGSFDLRTL